MDRWDHLSCIKIVDPCFQHVGIEPKFQHSVINLGSIVQIIIIINNNENFVYYMIQLHTLQYHVHADNTQLLALTRILRIT